MFVWEIYEKVSFVYDEGYYMSFLTQLKGIIKNPLVIL